MTAYLDEDSRRGTLAVARSIRVDITILVLAVVMVLGAIGSLVGARAGLVIGFLPRTVASWLAIAIFAPLGFRAVSRLMDTRPRLVISDDGIVDRTGFLGGELFIPWDQVRDVRPTRSGRIAVELRDPPVVEKQAGPYRRWAMRVSRWMRYAPVEIPAIALEASARNVAAMLSARLDQRQVESVREARREVGRETSDQAKDLIEDDLLPPQNTSRSSP